MKTLKLSLVGAAMLALSSLATAQVTFAGGAQVTFDAYNPNGSTAPQNAGLRNALISGNGGLLTATFLGYEAIDTNTYSFSLSSGTLNNKTSTVDTTTISGPTAAGNLNFLFSDLTTGESVANGGSAGVFASYAVLGTFSGATFSPYTKGGLYDLVLGFNDGLKVDFDYDDIVVGLKMTAAIPEPETYALMLGGLALIGSVVRRRMKK